MKIKKLDEQQLSFIYETHMVRDFPRNELKPLNILIWLMEQEMYDCLGLYDDQELAAYALFLKHEKQKTLLLDYLAVTPEYRAGGVGSTFIELMKSCYADYHALVLECESENTAPDETQREIRKRRIRFYQRNGCQRSRVKSFVFGVEYDVIYLLLHAAAIDPAAEIKALYEMMLPDNVMAKKFRMWHRHKILNDVCQWHDEADQWQDMASLCAALRIGTGEGQTMPRVISFVGAGGKTSTMYQLADELAELGLKVVVTTSTHIRCPQEGWIVTGQRIEDAVSGEWQEPIVIVAGVEPDSGKLIAPGDLMDPAAIARILEKADVILVEADGSRGLPLKVPADHEPVLMPQSDMVIACAGLSAIGKCFGESCFRFNEQGAWLHREAADRIEPEDVALILMDERGSKKGVSGLADCQYRLVFNQVDDENRKQQAAAAVRLLPRLMKGDCVLTAYERDEECIGKQK